MSIPKNILGLITRARLGLTNARDTPEVAAALLPFGYDPARLGAGLALADAAEAEAERKGRAYAARRVATSQLATEVGALRASYVRHVKLARVAFAPGTEGAVALGLRGRRAKGKAALAAEARAFYGALGSASAETRAALAALSVGAAAIAAGLAQVEAVEAALVTQQHATAEAQQATVVRDAAVAELRGFWGPFARVAAIALEDRPQLREVIGLRERS